MSKKESNHDVGIKINVIWEKEREKKIIQMKQRMQGNFRKIIQDDCTTCQHMLNSFEGICEKIDLTTNIQLEFISKR